MFTKDLQPYTPVGLEGKHGGANLHGAIRYGGLGDMNPNLQGKEWDRGLEWLGRVDLNFKRSP
jgi:hypothetical protein